MKPRMSTQLKHRAGLLLVILHCAVCAIAAEPPALTLKQAQDIALQTHPRISAAELRALAAQQVTAQARAAFYPNFSANLTAAGAPDANTRIGAGGLNVSSVFERAAGGLVVSQLITDFGRTANLTDSARLRARAEDKNTDATRVQILFQVSAAYFTALEAQAVLAVARQTVATRQVIFDQVRALADNKLKSDLDVSFARVTLEEGKLLLAQAGNDLKSASAVLGTLLSEPVPREFLLVEEPMPAELSADTAPMVAAALLARPELARLRLERDSAVKFAAAEQGLSRPTLSAVGAAGVMPVRDSRLDQNYAAAGVNLNIPIFNGNLYTARQKEAELRARSLTDQLRDEENNVIRDVRIARLNVDYALERMRLTAQLLEHAAKGYDLAQARYKLGAGSIVELSQAQLNKTSAEIAQANAKYEHHLKRAFLDYQRGLP